MRKLDIPNLAALKSRAEAEYKKAQEAFDRVFAYRNECSNLLENIQFTSTDRRYLSDIWLNANTYERQYLREEQRFRRRGDRLMRKYDRAVIKHSASEKVLIDPNLGANVLKEYGTAELWLTYANDPSDTLAETRDRMASEKAPVTILRGS